MDDRVTRRDSKLRVALLTSALLLCRRQTAIAAMAPRLLLAEDYVGSTSCRSCHEEAWQHWSTSHHAKAIQAPSADSILGDFEDALYVDHGVETRFHRGNGQFLVTTEGPDRKRQEFPVRYVFGVDPLQQLLLELPGGRLQAFPIAWDSRPKPAGGQRWFHLFPDEKPAPGDPLHWTGYLQNWNLQCSHCHSTALHKNYDPASGTYATTFAELSVGCEACHGPGAAHAEWARTARPPYDAGSSKGLAARLASGGAGAWSFLSPEAAIASRSSAPPPSAVATCAPCHSRRTLFDESIAAGESLYESHRPAWLAEPLYFADGQQHDEVYVWGSFAQSKMFAQGVVCADCHDSHSLGLRADGNALCATCHRPEVFDTATHHHHAAGSTGSSCVECHMPARTYMKVDARRDHLLKVPRPDVAAAIGAPDACTGCHAGKTQAWAAEAMDRFYGPQWRSRPEVARKFHDSVRGGTAGARTLVGIANDSAQPAFLRASAAAAAEAGIVSSQLPMVEPLLRDDDAGVRLAALELLGNQAGEQRLRLATALVSDPMTVVRAEAALVLANAPAASLGAGQIAARDRGLKQYEASQLLNADQPFANVNLGNLYATTGRLGDARAAFERAVRIDPNDEAAYVNLADLERASGDEAACSAVLARGLSAIPDSAALLHARGLSLVRRGQAEAALADFAAASKSQPDNARYAYVHAVALHSTRKSEEAVLLLRRAELAHPSDVPILMALVSMLAEAGQIDAARSYANLLAQAMPDDPQVADLLRQLGAGSGGQH